MPRIGILHRELFFDHCRRFTVVSIQSRFDTSRLDTNRSEFVTHVKSIRYKLTEANSSIECFNDNDETVLQGETQYKYAE